MEVLAEARDRLKSLRLPEIEGLIGRQFKFVGEAASHTLGRTMPAFVISIITGVHGYEYKETETSEHETFMIAFGVAANRFGADWIIELQLSLVEGAWCWKMLCADENHDFDTYRGEFTLIN